MISREIIQLEEIELKYYITKRDGIRIHHSKTEKS